VVGAVLQSSLVAQVQPPRPDTGGVAPDTTAARDSLADTLQAPLARAEAPAIEPTYRWSREAMFASGAQTLAELLSVIPGVTPFRSGWISTPAVLSYLGDPARVRVFYDGLELDGLDPRTGEILDLVEVPLWTIEEVRVERAADELRVHLRSWRVRTTTPVTRTDIYTGDEDTNLYRGFFGRRFGNGLAFQLAGQQYSTSSRRTSDQGDALSIFSRIGWSRGAWNVDGTVVRTSRHRGAQAPSASGATGPPIPALDARRTDAYVRLAYGDPERGMWGQAIAGSNAFHETTTGTGVTPVPGEPVPDPDTTRSMAQYVFTGGITRGPLRVSVSDRLEVRESERLNGQAARLSFEHGWSAVSVFGERSPADSTMRAGAIGRLSLTDFLWLGGAISQRRDDEERSGAADVLSWRGEAGVRLGTISLSGGVLARDSVVLRPLVVYNPQYAAVDDSAAFGAFATIRGALWRDLFIDASGVRWDGEGPYRPQYQSRVQLYLSTRWLSRFPTGNFGFMAGVTHNYRSDVCFPRADATCDRAIQHRSFTARVELQILQAVLTFELDNPQLAPYERVPGFVMPRGVSYYGVRWEFYN
jgi:hypothetical protein